MESNVRVRSNETMLQIFIDSPRWFLRPRNTDWRYTRNLAALADYTSLSVKFNLSSAFAFKENSDYLIGRLFGNRQKALRRLPSLTRKMTDSEVSASGTADIVYTHGRVPINVANKPLVGWFYGLPDPAMQLANGYTVDQIRDSQEQFSAAAAHASVILQPLHSMVTRHKTTFPQFAERFKYCPFFLPHVRSPEFLDINAKHSEAAKLRIIFVGRDWQRKGLETLVSAVEAVGSGFSSTPTIDVVTSKSAPIASSRFANYRYHYDLPLANVQQLIREAHILVLPSKLETFGFVILEAMVAGCSVIACNYEAQAELLDNGSCGLLINSARDLSEAIRCLIDPVRRRQLATLAAHRLQERYDASATAQCHSTVFRHAVMDKQ